MKWTRGDHGTREARHGQPAHPHATEQRIKGGGQDGMMRLRDAGQAGTLDIVQIAITRSNALFM